MANRPIFITSEDKGKFFKQVNTEFEFHSGFAISQKQKSIRSLHDICLI